MKWYITVIAGVLGFPVAAFAQGTPNQSANGQAFLVHSAPVCPGPASVGSARCNSWVVTDAHGVPRATGIGSDNNGNGHSHGGGGGGSNPPPPPAGAYGTQQFRTAYGLDGEYSSGATVAIVDAYDNPTIEQDLATYSAAYNLPSCTTANGCFKKVNQDGNSNPKRLPRADQGWALEIALDVQAVHAVCPDCNILLVEAKSNFLSDLLVAESTAAARADVVSNSWGAGEFSSEGDYDNYFGMVPTTVSSGDGGYGAEWPAASHNVTAVGGTTLTLDSSNARSNESVWSGSGSGCSAYESQLPYQIDVDTFACGNRIVADVAADADPATGAAVYDSYGYAGQSGWFIVGGTSLSSPIIAAVYALAGNTSGASSLYSYSYPYSSVSGLYDVTQGANGSCGTSLCAGATGYDGPTGLGTPNGINAFN